MKLCKENTRKTKIIWSLEGRALEDLDKAMENINQCSFDALRIVYTTERSDDIIKLLRALSKKEQDTGSHVPVILDVSSEARAKVDQLSEPLEYTYGEKTKLVCDGKPSTKDRINLKTDAWSKLFKKDAKVYFGYGDMIFEINALHADYCEVTALQHGRVYPDSDVHVPETRNQPTVTCLNHIDVASFAAFKIDYIVVPGIASKREVSILRKRVKSIAGYMPWIIAKVDSERMVSGLKDVIDEYNGLLISRRELALSTNPATVPMITKEIIQTANQHAKVVISSSEVLGSMRNNPTPTRAEISDIGNSVMDGVDAVLLSQDLCHGPYMERALSVCERVILDVEASKGMSLNWLKNKPSIANEFDAISYQAYMVAKRVNAKAIVCLTKAGNTALKLASFRQEKPIIAVAFADEVIRRLSLVRGVEGLVIEDNLTLNETFPAINDILKSNSWLETGDTILLVSVTISPMGEENSNLMTVQKVS